MLIPGFSGVCGGLRIYSSFDWDLLDVWPPNELPPPKLIPPDIVLPLVDPCVDVEDAELKIELFFSCSLILCR